MELRGEGEEETLRARVVETQGETEETLQARAVETQDESEEEMLQARVVGLQDESAETLQVKAVGWLVETVQGRDQTYRGPYRLQGER